MNPGNTAHNPAPDAYPCHGATEHGAAPVAPVASDWASASATPQPIVDLRSRQIFAHEALVRGTAGEPAPTVLAQVNEDNRFRFDRAGRVKAIKTAARLGMQSRLSINFMPNAIYRPELCIRSTLEAARAHDFRSSGSSSRPSKASASATANGSPRCFASISASAFTAIDDFGAGFAGLNLLADFQPDIIKLTWT